METGNTVELQIPVNKPWQFQPGKSGNPAGKPKGARHFSTLFREAVIKVAEGQNDSDADLIVKKVIAKAKEGDLKAVDIIREEVDGLMPKGDNDSVGNTFNIMVVNFNGDNTTS